MLVNHIFIDDLVFHSNWNNKKELSMLSNKVVNKGLVCKFCEMQWILILTMLKKNYHNDHPSYNVHINIESSYLQKLLTKVHVSIVTFSLKAHAK